MLNVQRITNIAVVVVALAMVIYHMLSAHVILQASIPHLNTHVGFCLVLLFLAGLAKAKGKRRLLSLGWVVLALVCYFYVQVLWVDLQKRAFFNTTTDLIIGVIMIILVWEASRQYFGLVIPVLVLIFIIYPFIGHNLPEPFYCHAFEIDKAISVFSISATGETGIIGPLTSISIHYVFLFMVFAGVLQATGGATFFMLLAKTVAGRMRAGPAISAVISSCAFGSISGSVAANTVITGSFTIPLMKSVGYKPEQAGSIEAASSSGGQIMPPIMGAGAFIMAGFTDIPYIQICVLAVMPALIYYFSVGAYVYLRAGQLNIRPVSAEDRKVDPKELLLMSPVFIVPFITVVTILIMGYSVMYAAFWTIVVSVVVSLIRKKTRPSLGQYIDGFTKGAVNGAGIGAVLACITLVQAGFTMSGLGIKLTYGIEQWSGGYFIAALAIIWFMSILLGMGGVGTAAYIIVAIFSVPALMIMGVPFIIAHFFIYFASTFHSVTPPMAGAAIVASKLAGASYWKTAIETGKVALVGLILPFAFVYTPLILLQPLELFPEVLRLIGFLIALLALQITFVGYYRIHCTSLERMLAAVSAVLLLAFIPVQNNLLFAIGVGLFILLTLGQWRKWRQMRVPESGLEDIG